MKRALSFILIFIALSNIVGFMPLYFSLMQEVKSEASLAMAKGETLQKIKVTKTEYCNPAIFTITDDNEFCFNGQRYDYKDVKRENGDFVFYALQDNKETGLVNFLTSMFGQQDNAGKNTNGPMGNLLKSFSKDFIGSFSMIPVLIPVHRTACFFSASVDVRAGYCRMLQAPPDAIC